MPTTPYAKLFASINGGALADDGITAAVSDTVDLSAESTVGWPASGAGAPRWEIYGFPPSFTVPAGWSTDATTGAYYYLGTSPPQFTLTVWGKYMLRLLVQGGGGSKTDESTAISVPATSGLLDLGEKETNQFGASWGDNHRANLRVIASGLGVAKAPADAVYLVGAASSGLSAEVVWTSIGTTVAFASTATQPCSFSRTDTSVTDTAVTARTLIALGGTVANGFGVAEVYQAEGAGGTAIDAGSLACCWTDITGASEDAEWVLRSRKAGAALTDASTVAARISPLGVTLPALAGSGTRAVTADANGVLATAALASATALYLEDATSAVTTNGRPIRNLAAALDFNRANGLPVTAANTLATSGTKIPLFSFRRLTGGAGANNDGGYISFTIPDSGSAETEAARLGWSWQNVTGTYGEVTLAVRNNLGLSTQYTFDSGGKLTTTNLAATGLSTAGLVTNSAAGLLSTSATAVLCDGTVPANLTAGINIQNFATPLTFGRTQADDDNVQPVLYITRAVTGAPGVANVGGQIVFTATDDASDDAAEAGTILWRMTNVTNGAHAAELVLGAATGGSVVEVLAILGTGSAAFRSTLTPSITQTKRIGTGSNVGATLSVTAQSGQDVAAGTNNDGGAIEIGSGSVGGGGTGGAAGDVVLKTGSTARLTLQGDGSDALFASATTTHVVERSVPYNGGDSTGAVTLDFSQSNKIEVGALVDNVTFTISGAVVGARYSVIVRQHASAAKTTTWANGLFASGRDAIGTTVGTYTAWQFEIMTGGTIVCVGREADIVIP